MLDLSSADATPPLDGLSSAEAFPVNGDPMLPTMALQQGIPPMPPPFSMLPPMAFLQEQEQTDTIYSEKPIGGCGCHCANNDKYQESVMAAQRNAMSMTEFPEDEFPRYIQRF